MASPAFVYARAVNLILGSGVVAVPYAFAASGIIAAGVCLCVVSALSYLTNTWLLEVSEHANALQHLYQAAGHQYPSTATLARDSLMLYEPLLEQPETHVLVKTKSITDAHAAPAAAEMEPVPERQVTISTDISAWVTEEKPKTGATPPNWQSEGTVALEMSQMSTIWLGTAARRAWLVSVTALQLCAMWACCAVWVACAEVAVSPPPAAPPSKYVVLAVFSCIILPLCLIDPQQLGPMQLVSAAATICTILMMFITVVQALINGRVHADEPPSFELLVVSEGGIARFISTLVFSQLVQQSIPKLAHDAAQPESTARVLLAAVFTACTLYTTLGATSAYLFRQDTEKVITLNWMYYTAGYDDPLPGWTYLISRWVSLLPLFTTTSAYPLFNATLAANLLEVLPEGPLRYRWLTGLMCGVPPILCTMLIKDTSIIFALAGLCGFVVMFVMPALLLIASRRRAKTLWGRPGLFPPSSTPFSNEAAAMAVLMGAAVAFGFSAGMLVLRIADGEMSS